MTKRLLTNKEKAIRCFLESNLLLENACEQNAFNIEEFSKDELNFTISFKKQLDSPIKNQHYVPQFYLKQFENEEGRIETLDKINGKILKSQSKKKICSDLYFYAKETGAPDILSQLIERQLQKIEDEFASIYDNLVYQIINNKQLNEEYLYTLCLFVNNLHLRGKKFRENLEQSQTEFEQQITQKNIPKKVDNSIHLEFLLDRKNFFGFANLLRHQKIRFYIATGENNFVTSDNPVVEMNPGPIRSFYGYGYPERIRYFPLNPRILIEFSDPNKPGKKIKRERIDNDKVCYYNLIRSAYSDFLYSLTKHDLQERLYTIARMNYVDELYELLPEEFGKDKKLMDKYKTEAKLKGIDYHSNYELLNNLGLLI